MNHVSDLKDIGITKRCLIVGGGHSVKDIDFDKIPPDVTIICTNNHATEYADIIIYYDKDIQKLYKNKIVSCDYMIGFLHKKLDHTCDQCTHYYNYNDIVFGDTGFHSLQLADKIFNFTKIYLVGYDYSVCGKSYHYEEEVSDEKKMSDFVKASINEVKNKYKTIYWNNEIYNTSENSNLSTFKHKKLDN
jgi:hypothetical protein